MNIRFSCYAIAAMAAFSLVACSDPTSSDHTRRSNASAAEMQGTIVDFALEPRFDVSLEVAGELRPSTAIKLTARATG